MSEKEQEVTEDTTNWVCAYCNGVVSSGAFHFCFGKSQFPSPQEIALDRIGVALERIASALEQQQVKDTQDHDIKMCFHVAHGEMWDYRTAEECARQIDAAFAKKWFGKGGW